MFEFQRECCRKDDLTLERALDIAREYEKTERNVQGMLQQQPKESKLIYYNYNNNNSKFDGSKKSSEKCYHCGGLKHAESSKCRARVKICNKCGKKNHFTVVCKSASLTKGLVKRDTKSVSHLAQQPLPGDEQHAVEYAEFMHYQNAARFELLQIGSARNRSN